MTYPQGPPADGGQAKLILKFKEIINRNTRALLTLLNDLGLADFDEEGEMPYLSFRNVGPSTVERVRKAKFNLLKQDEETKMEKARLLKMGGTWDTLEAAERKKYDLKKIDVQECADQTADFAEAIIEGIKEGWDMLKALQHVPQPSPSIPPGMPTFEEIPGMSEYIQQSGREGAYGGRR